MEDGPSGSGSSSSYSSEDGSGSEGGNEGGAVHDVEGSHDHPVVTGANADPAVLQHFWDLASLQEVSCRGAAGAVLLECSRVLCVGVDVKMDLASLLQALQICAVRQ